MSNKIKIYILNKYNIYEMNVTEFDEPMVFLSHDSAYKEMEKQYNKVLEEFPWHSKNETNICSGKATADTGGCLEEWKIYECETENNNFPLIAAKTKILNLAVRDESEPYDSTEFIVSFEIREDIQQPEQALRNAVQEFINSGTDEAKQALSNARGLFNWGDAMTAVPDNLFIKHGLTKLNTENVDVFVNLNEILSDYISYQSEERKQQLIIVKIKKLIRDYIIKWNDEIKYWLNGENLYAERMADKISEQNEKLKNLLAAEIIDADYMKKLIEAETAEELIVIYEEILEYLETSDGTEDGL